MLRVYACLVQEHDLRLVVVAGLICALAAVTAFSVLARARESERRRTAWLGLTAFVTGIGIWSTHFIAMLAFDPGIPIGYDPALTLLSIAAAVGVTGFGWRFALSPARSAPLAAGTVIGVGIGTMHFIGMSAVNLGGRIVWDEALVAASFLIGMALSVAAVAEHGRRPTAVPWRPALLFVLAICGLHFTAMGAAGVIPDPRLRVPAGTIDNASLTIAVAAAALIILTIGLAFVLLDLKLARRAAEETRRLRTLADAAVEGLVIVDGDQVVDANQSFLKLAGYQRPEDLPQSIGQLLPDVEVASLPDAKDSFAAELRLLGAQGAQRDVEVLARPLEWEGRELTVLAVRDVSERKEAAARIAHLAYHDALTGLPNRAVLGERLEQMTRSAAASSEPLAVVCLDLDGFKGVNDLYGHPIGDELLIEVAQRLRSLVTRGELVARLGGDEFAIVQLGGAQPQDAGALAARVVRLMAQPFELTAQTTRINCSAGIALFPGDADNPTDLIKNADMALYRAKAEGRGLIRFYEAAMDEALRQRRQLDADLRQAIDNGQLDIHYQPLAELETGRIVAFEALLRWTHPEHGNVSPATFIPLAEESGFILTLGNWVLRRACAEAAAWTAPLRLSVNLSPIQVMQGDLPAEVARILVETGLEPSRLDLEVTEGLLLKDADAALAALNKLKALGVGISMDDFGTGYSSLSYFRMFPFDKVKIDQSFVREMTEKPQALAIIRSVIGLGHGLNMPVIAEGVETAEQLNALQQEGCTQVQGYLIAEPGPIEAFKQVLMGRGRERPSREASA